MKIITLIGRGVLILSCACLALACSQSSATPNAASTNTAAASSPAPAPTQNPEDLMTRVKPDEAKKLVDDGKAIIIDVRGTDAWKQSHIKGALDIQLGKLESGDYQNLPKDKRIIAYCT